MPYQLYLVMFYIHMEVSFILIKIFINFCYYLYLSLNTNFMIKNFHIYYLIIIINLLINNYYLFTKLLISLL